MGWITVATDNFNRLDQNPLAGNWSTSPSCYAMQLVSNTVKATQNANWNSSYWNANSFYDDQYSFAARAGSSIDNWMRVQCRTNISSGNNNYIFTHTPNGTVGYLDKVVNGTSTALGSSFTVPYSTLGNKYKIQAVGTTIYAYVDDAGSFVEKANRTDSTHTSGNPGLNAWDGSPGLGAWDNWEGGHDAPGHPAMRRWGGIPYMTLGRRKW